MMKEKVPEKTEKGLEKKTSEKKVEEDMSEKKDPEEREAENVADEAAADNDDTEKDDEKTSVRSKAAKYNLSGTEVTEMYIPVRTSFVTVHEKEAYPSVNFSYDDDTSIESLMKDIDEYINNRYYHDNKMFRARSYSDTTFIKQVERIMNTVSIVVAVIAWISRMPAFSSRCSSQVL